MPRFALGGFYAILDIRPGDFPSPRDALPGNGAEVEEARERAAALLEGHPGCLQLRAKGHTAAALHRLALAIAPLCRHAGVPFCVNDRLDVALAVGADAVHLGQDDLPLADARQLVTSGRRPIVIGISTHTLEQALAATEGGADYIGFGPVFATGTKTNPDPVVGLARLAEVCRAVSLPVVAIGGITRRTLPDVVAAGAAAAALISDIDRADNPAAAAREASAAFLALP